MPADRAKGRLAIRPMHRVPRKEARAVASSTAVLSMPVEPKMDGLTARI